MAQEKTQTALGLVSAFQIQYQRYNLWKKSDFGYNEKLLFDIKGQYEKNEKEGKPQKLRFAKDSSDKRFRALV